MILIWSGFILIIIGLLALDLGVFNRKAHVIGIREAMYWSLFWISLGVLFSGVIYFMYENHWLGIGTHLAEPVNGHTAAIEYITGYIIEKSLSLDNIFVIALIFSYFKVPALYQHRVLFWGILGAIVLRGVMIGAGAFLISKFFWMNYIFGAFLIFTSVRMFMSGDHKVDPDHNPLVKLARKIYPVTSEYHGKHFMLHHNGRHFITPLFVALLVVESSDVMFAVDSIPAIFAVTHDPFIVFTSNIFAILGLRSLYFALAAMIEKFIYLKFSLVIILAYVGVKMILAHIYPIPTLVSLIFIALVLSLGIFASIAKSKRVNRLNR